MIDAVIGVDPGAHGAAVLITRDRRLFCFDFAKHTEKECGEKFRAWSCLTVKRAGLERVNNRPGQANTFAYGENCGVVRGFMIMTCGYEYVESKKWQYHHGLGGKQHAPGGCSQELLAKNRNNPKSKHKTGIACDACEYRARKQAHCRKAQELEPTLKVTLANCDAILICRYFWDLEFGGPQIEVPKTTRLGSGIVRIESRVRG